jgi:hypothetical protein
VSLYFLFQQNIELTTRQQEKRKWLFYAIGSAAFVVGGIFMIIIRPDRWIKGSLVIGFFGLCFLSAIRSYRKA